MIQFSKISTRYAKAIYEYAAENKAEADKENVEQNNN